MIFKDQITSLLTINISTIEIYFKIMKLQFNKIYWNQQIEVKYKKMLIINWLYINLIKKMK